MSDRPAVAFVTGINQGIGYALASALLQDGWVVWGTSRRPAAEVVALFEPHLCGGLRPLQLELSDLDACAAVGTQITGPLDVVVNSAAGFGNDAFHGENFLAKAFLDTMAANTVAPAVISRVLKPRLMERSRRLLIMMSTGNASLAANTTGGMLSYRASKSALNQVVRTLAAEWREDGITTVALNPGWVKTRMGGELAPLRPMTAAQNIVSFIRSAGPHLNGSFINTDCSPLPW